MNADVIVVLALNFKSKLKNWGCQLPTFVLTTAINNDLLKDFVIGHKLIELKKAKKQLLKKLNQEITQITNESQVGIGYFSAFNDILVVRDRVDSMTTWGIDNPIFLKFALTFLVPIVLGALFQLGFESILG